MTPRILLISGSGFLGGFLKQSFGRRGWLASDTDRRAPAELREGWDSRKPREPRDMRCERPFIQRVSRIRLDLEQDVRPQLEPALKQSTVAHALTHAVVCAAVTDVEACFRDPQRSRRVNVEAYFELLDLFETYRIKPVFFSSDLVFDSQTGLYDEGCEPNPTTVYGRQKLEIETAIRDRFADHLIFRTSKLMSLSLHPRNILTPIVRSLRQGRAFRALTDQFVTPAFVEDVAEAAATSIERQLNGTFHLASKTVMSRFEMAHLVRKRLGAEARLIEPMSFSELGLSEPRGPHNTLSSHRQVGLSFREIENGLQELQII